MGTGIDHLKEQSTAGCPGACATTLSLFLVFDIIVSWPTNLLDCLGLGFGPLLEYKHLMASK